MLREVTKTIGVITTDMRSYNVIETFSEKHFKVMKASTWNKIYGDYLKGNIQEHEKSIQNKTH